MVFWFKITSKNKILETILLKGAGIINTNIIDSLTLTIKI